MQAVGPSTGTSSTLQPGTKVQVGKYVVQVEKFLSEGGFAHVYVASLVSPTSIDGFSPSQKKFVLKRMAVPDKSGLVEVRREVDVMKQLRPHKNIVYFIEASASSLPGTLGFEIFILMEWCPGGGIIDLLNSRLQNRLTESEILKIFSDTVDAVAHMHGQDPVLMHRDLKVENILVAASNSYKLCDFGSTTTPLPRPPATTAEIQAMEADLNRHTTLQYRAPEMVDVWSRRGVTEKAGMPPLHIWALGVFLYKLCYYTTPFESQGPLAIMNVQYQIPAYPAYSNSIKYLIGLMLQELAQSRPDVWQVHEHTCRLRGISSYLVRPKKKNNPMSREPMPAPKPSKDLETQKSSKNGAISIFSQAPAPPESYNTSETVVPMRRGRPTGKLKPEQSGVNLITTDTTLDKVKAPNSFQQTTNSKHSLSNTVNPPGEEDLFAREAAAGFGDSFLSPSPSFLNKQPTVGASKTPLEKNSPTLKPNSFSASAQPNNAFIQTASEPLSAFDDLLPSKKQDLPKTLNQIRGERFGGDSARNNLSTKSHKLTSNMTSSVITSQTFNHGLNSYGSNRLGPQQFSLFQKTGPQDFFAQREISTNQRKISLTQKTGPALSAASESSQPPPSLSELLRNDQRKLVSRSTQTSPSLLASLKISIPTICPEDERPPRSPSLSSDFEEGPENLDRPHKYGSNSLIAIKPLSSTKSVKESTASKLDNVPFKSLNGAEEKTPKDTTRNEVRGDDACLFGGKVNSPTATSTTTDLSSSEAVTEDEDVKARRRAAIEKFAPKAKPPSSKNETLQPEDPFSHQSSDLSSKESKTKDVPPKLLNKPMRKASGPPIWAPKPQSLKSAAAITNLVSRYETLSSARSPEESTFLPGTQGFNSRKPVFKPNTNSSTPNNQAPQAPMNTKTKGFAHIPRKSLGPGAFNSNDCTDGNDRKVSRDISPSDEKRGIVDGDTDSEREEPFSGVNQMKSKWESGALKRAEQKIKGPRADYGQK
ncbi:nak/nak-unclassified protein kinase [Phakopsora pachyrhizi]|uniref:non-specific serine/threonine protein kinase n=1 Tax=Phakopsora pachyrhizi TaxID=170000 RepID=A0AAV0BMZ2_PHAPC|nr:nak/nak-unclassified protein kinase [Phakopsora pachyrhizi]CAH7688665.1 nak/nak-unclassified protein kinase [Phakopsora pachyrhizi]